MKTFNFETGWPLMLWGNIIHSLRYLHPCSCCRVPSKSQRSLFCPKGEFQSSSVKIKYFGCLSNVSVKETSTRRRRGRKKLPGIIFLTCQHRANEMLPWCREPASVTYVAISKLDCFCMLVLSESHVNPVRLCVSIAAQLRFVVWL